MKKKICIVDNLVSDQLLLLKTKHLGFGQNDVVDDIDAHNLAGFVESAVFVYKSAIFGIL